MKRTIYLLSSIAAIVAIVSFSGCGKDPLKDMTPEESRIYITNHDSQTNFKSYATFSIVDSVAVLTNTSDSTKKALTDYDKQLIASVTAAMQERGYTLVGKNAKPDLGINLTRIDNTFYTTGWNPGWWGGYWDPGYWGYPGFGWYYPPYYQVYQVRERQTAIDLFDLKNPGTNNQLTAVWNSLWRGTNVWTTSNVPSMVQASFAQSPYLTNK
ncbi:DUF4136 domain-containing protein [Chitinophaga sp. Cy-1792]|uniref:DUF4136 domain-containing protein n=1 Tax=Chitinophaga sp. Cy-1792 TaxID=2608339 RepID=UPI0014208A84|nr:DUF4136 domain-containing protein [Chitinophaga sp. Cy-1792]NIG57387.1 DUF4136 domain-containing protein [Chitinophaga sp. Cy-1792]